MTTSLFADVVVGDDHPAVRVRRSDHLLEEATVGLFDVGALRELGADVAQT